MPVYSNHEFNDVEYEVTGNSSDTTSRHPFCLSCILLAFSAAIGFRSTVGLSVAILALIIACVRASFEERELERRFGREYREYRSRVGMFVPKRKITRTPE